jgi:hypothetical protein
MLAGAREAVEVIELESSRLRAAAAVFADESALATIALVDLAFDCMLAAKVVEVDLSDGVLDGKVRKVARTCTKCSRPVSQKHPRCLYCGEMMPVGP